MSNDIENWLESFNSLNPESDHDTTASETKTYKLDLFKQVLPALDRKDKFFYGKLSQEEQDSISPWLLMRWMTSASNNNDQPHYVFSVNNIVNVNFSCMSPRKSAGIKGHEELQWMLLSICGTGRTPQRKFISPAKGAAKDRLEEAVSRFFPNFRSAELELFIKLNSKEDLHLFFKDNGLDDKSIKEIFKSSKTK